MKEASRRSLRTYFDQADDFLTFCGKNYLGINLIKNLAFDMNSESTHQELIELDMRRYRTLAVFITHDFHKDIFSDIVIIYGAGIIGTEL